MPRTVHANHSSESAVYIDSADSSSSQAQQKVKENAPGNYAEGQVARTTNSNTAEKNFIPICPAPVRIAVGVFCGLGAVAGMALTIVGGNALNSPTDPEANLHRVMLGSGAAMLGLGFLGVLSTQVSRENLEPSAAPV
jgi:hypothetical protein